MRLGFALARGAAVALCLPGTPRAQRRAKDSPIEVTGVVAARTSNTASVVSISADSSLTRAQTWQDEQGFHVVLYKGRTSLPPGRGYKVQRIGDSLEIIVPVKRGSKVTVQPGSNRLDLVVNGQLDEEARASAPLPVSTPPPASRETARVRERLPRKVDDSRAIAPIAAPLKTQTRNASMVSNDSARRSSLPAKSESPLPLTAFEPLPTRPESSGSAQVNSSDASSASAFHVGDGASPYSSDGLNTASLSTTLEPPLVTQTQTSTGTPMGMPKPATPPGIFSLMGALVVVVALGVAVFLFVARRRRVPANIAGEELTLKTALVVAGTEAPGTFDFLKRRQGDGASVNVEKTNGHSSNAIANGNGNGNGKGHAVALEKVERRAEVRSHVSSLPAVIFGAYRIDQEVSKLVSGEAHSIDTVASRAVDDRRAVEASLVKMLRAHDLGEDNHRRARLALEEYGFVARQSATLLLSSDTYDRVSAARVLGEIRSESALPFLLEALYDTDALVRTEVVSSLGALGLPSAIGALIDMARRHPEIPPAMICPALNACSVEAVEMKWNGSHESRTFALGGHGFTGDIIDLDPVGAVEQLPEWLEDETLADSLERLESVDVEARIAAAQSLAQFQVQRAVDALSAMALNDASPAVRAAAITSLGIINHESVFVAVLTALADESREVCAAAARALSRLSFERADAYARVIETADPVTLRCVAHACVASGMAERAIDRLASDDRRQAYEAFSMVTLLVKADETKPVFHAIENHPDVDVRLVAVRLAGLTQHPELVSYLRQLAKNGSVPESVRAAILETVYKSHHSTLHDNLTGAEMV